MGYAEDDYLMISGIQHYYFCKRQWGLIHIDQQWEENEYTIEGQILHEKADNPYVKEKRGDRFTSRAMHVSSVELGFYGVLDIVEFHKSNEGIQIEGKKGFWRPYIVEYKRGKPKKDERDIVQLVAEIMCLEETLKCQIDVSFLYYHSVNKKVSIEITDDLRYKVNQLSDDMHNYYNSKKIPQAEYFKNCNSCSLYDICMPRINKKPRNIENYIDNMLISEDSL